MTHFRVATYNVHKCKGIDWRVSPERIAKVIIQLDADILAIQEVIRSQAEAISVALELPFVFGCARLEKAEPYGNAVFSRLPIISSENFDLTVAGYEPRRCLRVSVALTPAQPLHFFAVHLGTSSNERRHQLRLLLSPEMMQQPAFKAARIVAGDFNNWTRGLASQFSNQRLNSPKRRNTFPAFLPLLHLDHIYYDAGFQLRRNYLHRSAAARIASDHLPLVADFESAPANLIPPCTWSR